MEMTMLLKSNFSSRRTWYSALSTMASGVGAPYFARICFSRLPPFTPMRMGMFLLLAGIHHRLHPVIVADVAGVDADLIHAHVCAGQSRLVVKMDVCHEWGCSPHS